MKIYFIRHAQGEHNLSEKHWQVKYPKLTELGIQQCKNVKSKFDTNCIDLILVSPLRRTLQTSENIFGKRKSLAIELIKEAIVNPCDLRESKTEVIKDFQYVNFNYVNDECDFNKLESLKEVRDRCHKFYLYLLELNKDNVAVVTHGAFLREFLNLYASCLSIENTDWFENCEVRVGNL